MGARCAPQSALRAPRIRQASRVHVQSTHLSSATHAKPVGCTRSDCKACRVRAKRLQSLSGAREATAKPVGCARSDCKACRAREATAKPVGCARSAHLASTVQIPAPSARPQARIPPENMFSQHGHAWLRNEFLDEIELADSPRALSIDNDIQLVLVLKVEPKSGSCPKELTKAHGGVSHDTTFAQHNFIDSARWHADLPCKFVLRQLQLLQKILLKHFSRMNWLQVFVLVHVCSLPPTCLIT